MNYKVLYRKYRPDDFDNIVGQDYIVKILKNSIINENVSHAYIFSGPRGTGKTTTAKVFSKALNCLENKEGQPCGECIFCKNAHENPDIIEIDAASNNGVEEIRNLIDNIKLTPTNGKYKVYIIDEVHMLTVSAFNALLLTLEEPPKHAIFILATTNIENVPITILSRCQRLDFKKINIDDIINRLKEICLKENISIENEALREIAYLSEGGLRDALSLLDQLSKSKEPITLDIVEKTIKTISQKSLQDLIDTIEDDNIEKFLELINDYRIRAIDYKTLVKKLIDISAKRAKNIKLTNNYQRLLFQDYKNLILKLTESLNKTNINVDSYTILEMILLELFSDNLTDKKDNFKLEDENVKHEENACETNLNSKTFDTKTIEIRINNCFVNAQKVYLETVRNKIADKINLLEINGPAKAILLDANVVAASDKYLIFTCETDFIANNANLYLNDVDKELTHLLDCETYAIFISTNQWNLEKQKYINNLKNNYKYTYIPENKPIVEDELIKDVFDMSKIEII